MKLHSFVVFNDYYKESIENVLIRNRQAVQLV